MTQAVEDRECTENCKSVNHGDIISASLTKRCVPEADLWCFIKYVCCCCESVKDSSGRTALHVAASCGKTEIIQRLCKHKHINLNARDLESGYTPLHRSIFYGKIDAAVSLMKLGELSTSRIKRKVNDFYAVFNTSTFSTFTCVFV